MRRDHLNVFDLPFTVGALVLDSDIGEMDVSVDNGQVVASSPLCDLAIACIRIAFRLATFAIQVAKETLVVPLELVVQDHALHDGASTPQPAGGVQIGPVELSVVGQLAGFHDACVELLSRLPRVATAVSLEKVSSTVGERDERGLLTAHDIRNRVDQPGFP
jgi:hypothetical protein